MIENIKRKKLDLINYFYYKSPTAFWVVSKIKRYINIVYYYYVIMWFFLVYLYLHNNISQYVVKALEMLLTLLSI